MKILVVDNDKILREGLVKMIKKIMVEPFEIDEANSVKTGLGKIANFNPDLVFLDVEMDDGTGFDLLQLLDNYSFQLVFITAHNKYAIDAFRFAAINFLQKPIDPLELIESINRFRKGAHLKTLTAQLEVLKEGLQKSSTNQQERTLALSDSESINYVRLSDIVFCESDSSYTTFVLTDKKRLVVSKTMKEYEDLLTSFQFLRVHHSYIVNMRHVLAYDKKDGGDLLLTNNIHIPVSVRKKEAVLQALSAGK
jgi:two-component system LytT family response regulator